MVSRVVQVEVVTVVNAGHGARRLHLSDESGVMAGQKSGRDPERGCTSMKRMIAALFGLLLVVLTPALMVPVPAVAAPVSRDQAVSYVIARGLAQRGVPYSWAGGNIDGPSLGTGAGASIVGFDSSGLIQYIYAGVNAKLPRSSGAMYNVGEKVTPAQALPADLIFYGPEGSQSVTMFLGNNEMLEVTDAGVAVSPVRTTDMAPYLVRIIA